MAQPCGFVGGNGSKKSQLVEQGTLNPKVTGSSPVQPTNTFPLNYLIQFSKTALSLPPRRPGCYLFR